MSFEDDWEKVVSRLKSSYPDRMIDEGEERIQLRFSHSTFLTLEKDGFVEGSMPKHHFETGNAESVEVKNDITVVRGEKFEYLFKES
ncbi:hypothetical protein AQV86_04715 [Nanohaloarchaea archaeon SG9]|nr:hypothetical protein AQV86_04715 [Nanohaloarchaea archaeon SG9]